MGGDQLVAALAGEGFDREHGDEVRAAEKVLYAELIGEVEPLAGARALMEDLKGAGHTIVLASSAKTEELEHYLTLLDARALADDWTDSGDVEKTKPEPDLVLAALEKVGAAAKDAVMIGDSTWDCQRGERRRRCARSASSPAVSARGSCSTRARRACSSRSTTCVHSSTRRS